MVGRPRRSMLRSIESSWMRVAMWMSSTTAPQWMASSGVRPSFRATRRSIVGRTRLPFIDSTCRATSPARPFAGPKKARIMPSTWARSSSTGAWNASSTIALPAPPPIGRTRFSMGAGRLAFPVGGGQRTAWAPVAGPRERRPRAGKAGCRPGPCGRRGKKWPSGSLSDTLSGEVSMAPPPPVPHPTRLPGPKCSCG